jgi:hypothetical protein
MRLGTFAEHVNRRFFRRSQSGQAIILLALGMVVLLVFVGLVTDVALLFVRYSQLRRAIHAASIAAAGQVRENRDYADVALTARQFIRLYDLDPDRVLVQTCVTNPTDPALCVNPPRKLVRVIAQVVHHRVRIDAPVAVAMEGRVDIVRAPEVRFQHERFDAALNRHSKPFSTLISGAYKVR